MKQSVLPRHPLACYRLLLVLALASGFAITPITGFNEYAIYDGLDSFPHDIPLDVNFFAINFASFDVIDYIEPFPELYILRVIDSDLTEIPDLCSLTTTILQRLREFR